MRNWIDIINEAATTMPAILYHGTSDLNWENGGTKLYLTSSLQDAENYADEAVTANYPSDYQEGDPAPSTAIIVAFHTSDILALTDVNLEPDWGWGDLADDSTWHDSLMQAGSFCVSNFGPQHKALGKVSVAFP